MNRLRGIGGGGGQALGQAVVIRSAHDFPVFPGTSLGRREPEPVEVVVVSWDLWAGIQALPPWIRIVGLVIEEELPDFRANCPVVTGVRNARSSIPDGELVLVDGDSGLIFASPDAVAIAHFQAERERIAPRKRLFLDYRHQSARTLDGREVRVYATVQNLEEVADAIENGADGLYLQTGSKLLQGDWDDSMQLRALMNLTALVHGKPITIAGDFTDLSAGALLEAAAFGEFILAIPRPTEADRWQAWQTHLADQREERIATDQLAGDFRLAALLTLQSSLDIEMLDPPPSRIVIQLPDEMSPVDGADFLRLIWETAAPLLIPIEIVLPDAVDAETAIQLGTSGIVVATDEISRAKETIRSISSRV